MTRAQKHMRDVKMLGCVLCMKLGLGDNGGTAEAHHAFDSAARSDWLTVALCSEHHRGPTGFHGLGEREFNRRYKTSEAELLAMTLEKLA